MILLLGSIAVDVLALAGLLIAYHVVDQCCKRGGKQ